MKRPPIHAVASIAVAILALSFACTSEKLRQFHYRGNPYKDTFHILSQKRFKLIQDGTARLVRVMDEKEAVRQLAPLAKKVQRAARQMGVDETALFSIFIAEHMMNADWQDLVQNAYAKVTAGLLKNQKRLAQFDESFSKRKECRDIKGSIERIRCFHQHGMLYGLAIDFPTFGPAQLRVDECLKVYDYLVEKFGYPQESSPGKILEQILVLEHAVPYAAAILKYYAQVYKEAGFPIADKPAVLATLFNVGNAEKRAMQLAALKQDLASKNVDVSGRRYDLILARKRLEVPLFLSPKAPPPGPRLNYFGIFVAANLDRIQKLYRSALK